MPISARRSPVELRKDLAEALTDEAKSRGLTRAAVLDEAVTMYLAKIMREERARNVTSPTPDRS